MKNHTQILPLPRLLLGCAMLLACHNARAQESFYRVYQTETPLQGWAEINLWTTGIPQSDNEYNRFGKRLAREGLMAYSLEAEYGAAEGLVLAAYADFEDPRGEGLQFSRGRVAGRYRFGQRFERVINTAVYAEYYVPNQSYSTEQELETRLIFDKDLEDFRLVLNPLVGIKTTGNPEKRVEPGFAGGLYYRRRHFAQPGIEIYNNFRERRHTIFTTVDFKLAFGLQWHIGAGFGLTDASDGLTLKSILTYEFNAIRPSRLFRRR